jgi:hypothetical protein
MILDTHVHSKEFSYDSLLPIRPRSRYKGELGLKYVPLEDR